MGNELKLSLENFQSISRGELIFHPGLNFIIGQSNSGKSATFRALKACLANPSGSQRFIKKGTKKASVQLEYNGNQIIWNRTPKESSYIINGETYLKTGSSSAFKILDGNTGFARDDNDTIMNIEEELQLPFPFGISASSLFKLYEDVFCISDSAVILKSAKGQEEDVKTSISQTEFDLRKCELKLEELAKFEEEVNLNYLRECRNYLTQQKGRLDLLKADLPFIKQVGEIVKISMPSTTTFTNYSTEYSDKRELKKVVKQTAEYHKLLKELPNAIEFKDLYSKYISQLDTKKLVEKVKEVEQLQAPSVQVFSGKLESYETLVDLAKIKQRVKALVAPEVKSFSNRLDEYEQLVALKDVRDKLQKLNIELTSPEFTSKLEELNSLKKYKEDLKEILSKGKSLKVQYNEITIKVEQLEEQLKEFKVCPLCHRPLREGENLC